MLNEAHGAFRNYVACLLFINQLVFYWNSSLFTAQKCQIKMSFDLLKKPY